MTIERTGYGEYDSNTNDSTGSFDITVPDHTNCLIVYVSSNTGTAYGLTGSSFQNKDDIWASTEDDYFASAYGLTCENIPPNNIISGDASASYYQGAGFVWLQPPIGAGVTIAWNFASKLNQHQFAWVAYKDVKSVRNYNSYQSEPDELEFLSSKRDLISIAIWQYYNSVTTATWTNASGIANYYDDVYSLLSIAEKTATGNHTITGIYTGGQSNGGIMGFVLIPDISGPFPVFFR